ncbi:glycine betaine ABC transporter substrate-binding protein [Rhodospirillaceae bacterium SYSU D60014]|uniref:glycine betaine ABC transporter substrate-binding protein n=1 Tax=Virgifigura deserti TaxID=2268457 RepID=UPI000E6707D9
MLDAVKNLALGTALIGGLLAGSAGTPANAQDDKSINIGWTAWSDAEAVTKMAAKILEERLGYDVELTLADVAIQYSGVASGDIDLMMMAWLPQTHQDYMEKFAGEVIDLGPLYTGARLGWAIPNYIPKDQLSSIEDLQKEEVAEKLGNRIVGIDPGAGLMRLSNEAVEEYGLDDYQLVSSSGAGMTAELDRAVQRDEWVVVTAWNPHWMFSAYELRYLEDPKGVLAGVEHIDALARKGFYNDHPEAAAFLARMYIPLEELETVMFKAQETSYEEAVAEYIETHEERVNYWVTGEIGE